MDTLQAVTMGFVQGLTEFLPVSSSAHIVFTSALYRLVTGQSLGGYGGEEEIFFDIMIHTATLLAVIIFFAKDILEILKGFVNAIKQKNYKDENFTYILYIALATFFTAVIGLSIKEFAESLVANPHIVCILLLVTGCILFFSEKLKQKNEKLNIKNAILIGIAQGLAVFPGLSRSGLTISMGIFKGLDRVKVAKFSFILSIPLIFGASLIYPILEFNLEELKQINYTPIIWGVLTSFVSGYICIKYFMQFISKSNLKCFAYYCWGAGVALFILFSLARHLV